MIKKVTLFILFFGFVDVVFISCCKDSILDYTKFNVLKVANTKIKESLPDSSVVSKSSYRIKLTLEGEFIASRNNRQLFMNSSYATSCENQGMEGLKSDITRFEITSNKEVFGILPGEKLTPDKFKAYEFVFYDDAKNKRQTINEWINIFNNGRFEQSHYNLYFEFTEDIISNEYMKFRILIEFEDGTILNAETNNIRII